MLTADSEETRRISRNQGDRNGPNVVYRLSELKARFAARNYTPPNKSMNPDI